jgi:DNA invertase Pin-like site-specific DNA recombinase
MEETKRCGVEVICTDQNIDTSSPSGKMMYTMLGAIAEFERDLIRERTKDGLARAKAQGKRLGRPPHPERGAEIIALRAQGMSLRKIGAQLGMSHQAVKQRLRRSRVQNREQSEE